MERINFQAVEKKWQKKFSTNKLSNKGGKNFIALRCFHIHQVKFIWVTLEIIQ